LQRFPRPSWLRTALWVGELADSRLCVSNFKAVHFRHLDIEEDQVRFSGENRSNGGLSIGTLGDNLHFGIVLQESREAATPQRFVVNDHCANLHTGTTPAGTLSADAKWRIGIEICTQTQRLPSSVELLKTPARIRKANAPRQKSFGRIVQRAGEILDFQAEALLLLKGPDGNDVGIRVLSDAVAHSVFHKRLENQSRNGAIERAGSDLNVKPEPITETPPLNSDVMFEKIYFASERDFVRVHFVQGNAKQLT
jgi:hypothetical protein